MSLFFLVLLVCLLAAALASGFPVAFSIPGAAILTVATAAVGGFAVHGDSSAFFVHGGPWQWLSAGILNFRSIYRLDDGDTLIAIPLFIFMGLMLQHSKVAEDLLESMARLLGVVRGGLGLSVVLVGALLAATTSVIGATVVTLGMISLPTLLRNGYSKPLASGIVAATGTLGQIVPPSIVLVILAHQLSTAVNKASGLRRAAYSEATGSTQMPGVLDVGSVSAGEIFIGAMVPAMVLVGLYLLYVAVIAARLKRLPAPDAEMAGGLPARLARSILMLVPPLALILLVLGSIIAGVATINQAAAIGAAGATVIAGARLHRARNNALVPAILALVSIFILAILVTQFELNLRKIGSAAILPAVVLAGLASIGLTVAILWSGWRTFRQNRVLLRVAEDTVKTTSLVFAILLGAVMLTAAFRGFGGEDQVRGFLHGLPGGFWSQFVVAMLIIFLLGFFLDFLEITVLVIPILAPILLADPSANITAVWLGVMIGLNIQTSFLTPPFGFALFYLRGVTPSSVRTTDIYRGVLPFVVLQLCALAIVGTMPSLVNYLPMRRLLLSEFAPPSTSPKLQYCVDSYIAEKLDRGAPNIAPMISKLRALELNTLPYRFRAGLTESLQGTEAAFADMKALLLARGAVADAAQAYRPLLEEVRAAQRKMVTLDERIRIVTAAASDVENGDDLAALQRARELAQRLIPADWSQREAAFQNLLNMESTAEKNFRLSSDRAYSALLDIIEAIEAADSLRGLLAKLGRVRSLVAAGETEAAHEAAIVLRRSLSQTQLADWVAADAGSLVRNLERTDLDRIQAETQVAALAARIEAELVWRSEAARTVLPDLVRFRDAIGDTIGLRSQRHLPRPIAVYVATCNMNPRDIYLYF